MDQTVGQPLPGAEEAERCRAALGLEPDAPLRLVYLPGPGDVQGTYAHWVEGRSDPRSLNQTYSQMFYDVALMLRAQALLVCRQPVRIRDGGAIRFARLERRAGAGGIGYHLAEARYAHEARRIIVAYDPHIVVASSDFPQMFLRHACGGRPVVLSLHNTYPHLSGKRGGAKHRAEAVATRWGLGALGAAVAVSDQCRMQLRSIVGSGVPIAVFVPQVVTMPRWRRRAAARRFLYVGRVERNKGVFDLLDAFDRVSDGRDDLRLTFAGSGGALDALRRAVAERGLADVECLGQLERKALADQFERSDVVVCPTRPEFGEGLAKPPLEAALFGAPSILSDVVPARVPMGDAAMVYPAGDVEALARAMVRMVREPDLVARMSAATVGPRALQRDPAASWGGKVIEAILRVAAPGA